MPTYQYACTECGERLEVVQKFTDDPLTVCPACAGRLRKLFYPVGVVFKGSGFYKTDSRSTAKTGTGTTSGESKSSESKSSESKSSAGDSSSSTPAAASDSGSSSESSSASSSSGASGGGSKVA
jgi:putative FmdB family regulatory protein